MIFSRKTDYAILLIDSLKTTFASESFLSVAGIAEKNQISRLFLEKLAQELKNAGILYARKGKSGGYRLAKNPRIISFLDVARVFEGENGLHCVKTPRPNQSCPLWKLSPVSRQFEKIDGKIHKIFAKATFV